MYHLCKPFSWTFLLFFSCLLLLFHPKHKNLYKYGAFRFKLMDIPNDIINNSGISLACPIVLFKLLLKICLQAM